MQKQTTLLDLDHSAADAAAPLVGKDQLTQLKAKLDGFEIAGHDERDFVAWSQYFDSHLQSDTSLSQRVAPSAAADAAAAQAAALAAKAAPVPAAAPATPAPAPLGTSQAKVAVLTVLLLCAFALKSFGGFFSLTSTGPTIGANQTTNFTTLVQVGTFNLSPQNLYQTTPTGVSNNTFIVYARLTFDGSNFFNIPQQWTPTNTALTPLTNVLWGATNLSLPIYATLSVSNGMTLAVSNYQPLLQN